ncbi:MAG: Gfo/Idh/MocA family oxidoreductase [Candidatus Ratteibacteria bacterium]|jgi:predicted dehydrogenase
MKKKYTQVGIGIRSYLYSEAIVGTYKESAQLLAICDSNPGRMDVRNKLFTDPDPSRFPGREPVPAVKTYTDDKFDKMLKEENPDTVIVTSMDSTHDDYICRAMKAGCDVITEKPMTINAEKCQKILETVKSSGKSLKVTFNARYIPMRGIVKELLMKEIVGTILSVDFCWNLNTSHGPDYFRRWHRNKKNSGGLLVHKATHHFDLVNWWLNAVPVEVYCQGHRKFYTPEQAESYGLTNRSNRCDGCPESAKCKFFLDMKSSAVLKELYLDQELYDGYVRDKCVFASESDIEDSMNAVVRYDNGVLMSYAMNAFLPRGGYAISFNGTKGRLENLYLENAGISGIDSGDKMSEEIASILVAPHFGEPYNVPITLEYGSHGGGDERLLSDLFSPNPPEDPLKRAAGVAAGAFSLLTGVAANESIRTGKSIMISDLADLSLLEGQ